MSHAKRLPDPTGTGHKHRYECPAGHTSWERTNSHVYCHGCRKERATNPDVDPEWYELYDKVENQMVSFEDLKEQWPALSEVRAY